METILVAGVESIVGANLAASLSDRYRVVGLALHGAAPSIADCETRACLSETAEAVRQHVAAVRPQHVVYCGPAAWSCWQTSGAPPLTPQSVDAAGHWARAAAESNARLTVIASDAAFTGPWMFHTESSDSLCPSPQAATLRAMEQRVTELCPAALIVRTNAYGWSPQSSAGGWIETMLGDLQSGEAGPFDYVRHGTPILATDLIEILCRAWDEELSGTYHVAGGERVNPCRFIEQLAHEFDLHAPLRPRAESLVERPAGFGCGETSLHTKKVRLALCVAMPTLAEGLERLRQQSENGYCDRLTSGTPLTHGRVA